MKIEQPSNTTESDSSHSANDTARDKDARHPIERLAEDFVARLRQGDVPAVDEMASQNAEHADSIRELFPMIRAIERLRCQRESSSDGRASLGPVKIERLGDFRILREIGRGGMGVVFEAEQESLGRRVALKVLPRQLLFDAAHLQRFQREARTAARLHHTNIVPVFGVGVEDGLHYYVMQRIDGVGLDQWARENSTDHGSSDAGSFAMLTRIGIQAADALQYAHEEGVLHRDVKPSNLLLDRDGRLWVADFGLARAIEQDGFSESLHVVGTLRYMAPEQIRGQTDARSDVYSLGVTLYELLTRVPAFQASDRWLLLKRIERGELKPLRQLKAAVPRDLETIVLKATACDPADRYQTAGELAADLRAFTEDRPIRARRFSSAERLWRWCRRNPAVATLSAATITLLVTVAIVASFGYWRVQHALLGETQARGQAEANSQLASRALNKIFDRFATGLTQVDAAADSLDLTTQPVLSQEAASMLQELLEYYDQLAAQREADPKLARQAAEARRRVGDIHLQLGNYEAAIEAHSRALEQFRQLGGAQPDDATRRAIARIHNGIGSTYLLLDRRDESQAEHRQALAVLQPDATAAESPQMRFEIAYTHFLLGKHIRPGMGPLAMPHARREDRPRRDERRFEDRRFPPGPPGPNAGPPRFGGPPGDRPPPPGREDNDRRPPTPRVAESSAEDNEHLQLAIDGLNQLVTEEPAVPAYRLLLAGCLREQVPDDLPRRTDEDNQKEQRAIALLQQLLAEFPDVPTYRYELVQTLAEFRVPLNELTLEQTARAEAHLRVALEHAELLAAEHPQIPEYAAALIHTCYKLGVTLEQRATADSDHRSRLLEEAERRFSQAVNLQSQLAKRYPDAPAYRVWLAKFQERLGALMRDLGRLDESHAILLRSIDSVRDVAEQQPTQFAALEQLADGYRSLAATLSRQGEAKLAEEARESAQQWLATLRTLDTPPDRNRPPPPGRDPRRPPPGSR